jgi:glucose-6-phosphate isomerase
VRAAWTGDRQARLSEAELRPWIEKLAPALHDLQRDYRESRLPLLRVIEDEADIVGQRRAGQTERRRARRHLLRHGWVEPRRQTLAPARRLEHSRPRRRCAEAPAAHALLRQPRSRHAGIGARHVRSRHARFVVTSKSGGTPETLAQALSAMAALRAAGLEARIPDLFLAITEPRAAGKANGLRDLFEAHGIPVLEHHTGIGGRFSG